MAQQGSSRTELLAAELESVRLRVEELESRLAHQQLLQRELEANHRFRQAVIDQAVEGVCICHDVPTHPFVQFTVWNHRMTEITGYGVEEINRLGWYQTLYPDQETRERARERMERMRNGVDLRSERWEIRRADGARRAIAISTSVLTATDGSVHVLALMKDLTEEEELERQRVLARTDDLTSVRNRRGFEQDAGLLFRLARRQDLALTLGYLDLGGFKALNDERGHLEGDRALRAIGEMLLASVRSTDVVGRVGGDEFALVLPGTNAAGARAFFDPLLKRLLDLARARGWQIGFGVGVVTYVGQVPELSVALREADAAMYRSKDSGRSSVVYERSALGGKDGGAATPRARTARRDSGSATLK